jgi:hypothetical protein
MSEAQARAVDRASEVIERLPAAGAALRAGEVTSGHVAALSKVEDPALAAQLLAHAGDASVDEFTRQVRTSLIAADGAGVAERQRRARLVSFFRSEEGCIGLRAVIPPVEGALVRSAIERICDERWRAAHPERAEVAGGHGGEPRERRLADALVEAVIGDGGPARGASRVGVVVVVEEATMAAHVAGADAIAGEDLRRLAEDPRTELYAAVRSMQGSILDFGRSRRLASALQRMALVARDGGHCAWPGCEQSWARCDVDHAEPWEAGGTTDLANLRHLCPRHHAHRHEQEAEGGPLAPAGRGP